MFGRPRISNEGVRLKADLVSRTVIYLQIMNIQK